MTTPSGCMNCSNAVLLFCLLFSPVALPATDFPEGDASLSSQGMPHIPEPLLFDLVRPLGAKRGEIEVNLLTQHNLRTGRNELAPEIEYAFADGLAIELELPFNGNRLEEYKMAVQGTLGPLRNGSMVHGWQVIGRHERHDGSRSADLLYLNGMEIGARWSTLNMVGIRRSEFSSQGRNLILLNNSIFVDRSQRVTVGLELNSEIDQSLHWRVRAIPQLHIDLDGSSTLQLGLGRSRLEPGEPGYWSLDWRLIRTF
jgi:hypothetical protein